MKMKSIFVTGTDTGVGKTLISKALIEYFIAQGENIAPMKPVASGADVVNGQLVNDDALILIEAANTSFDYAEVNPFVFKEPIAPHLAAKKNKTEIKIEKLNSVHRHLSDNADRVIIEGAGGWQVPLTAEESMADWVSENQWPVILVVGLRLGCINHARLSYLDILTKKNHLAGWVVNMIDPDVLVAGEIIEDLSTFIQAPLLGVVPWLENGSGNIQSHVDFSRLK